MQIPASLTAYAAAQGLTIEPLTFKFQGMRVKRKGYALKQEGKEVLTFEPCQYRNGDKWQASGPIINQLYPLQWIKYYKNIRAAVKGIKNHL